MKNILNPDFWVEIPAGECQIGLSHTQREAVWQILRDHVDYNGRSPHEQQLIDSAIEKIRLGKGPTAEEKKALRLGERGIGGAWYLWHIPIGKIVYVDTFYMARFPITQRQYSLFFAGGIPIKDLPDISEEPTTTGLTVEPSQRCAALVSDKDAALFCEALGGRFPTDYEWEKAARGTDGRLYPWGNHWNPDAGFFYYGQKKTKRCSDGKPPVDAYPQGVSPYGVWNMVGGIPELVEVEEANREFRSVSSIDFGGKQIWVAQRGNHPKEETADTAPAAHLAAQIECYPLWVTLRPALDKWPIQQWRGIDSAVP